jgi:methylated-DNA-[protein]-cysteine S-methyltransferase
MLVINYMSVNTRLGEVWFASTPKGLFRLNLGSVDTDTLRSFFTGKKQVLFEEGGSTVEKAAREVASYLDGRQKKFAVPLDLTGWSPFAKRVWRATVRIPFGQTRSYAWLAERLDGANFARAVGGALSMNPVPIIIPCHRVVGAHGALGGFTGGLHFKRWLLEHEAGSQTLPLAGL